MLSSEGKISRVQVIFEKVNITTIFVVFDINGFIMLVRAVTLFIPRRGGGGDFAYERVEMFVGNFVPKGAGPIMA